MSNYFSDRKSTYPNRYKVTPASGSAYYATLERADEPTEPGTALNATVLNDLVKNLANLHVWQQFPSEPHRYSLGEKTTLTVSDWGSTGTQNTAESAYYADNFVVADDGTVSLENSTSIVLGAGAESYTATLRGKFVRFSKGTISGVYYFPSTASLGVSLTSSGGFSTGGSCSVSGVQLVTPDENGEHLAPASSGYVCDFNENEYPINGKQDGKWYVYHKRLGD